MTLSAHNSQVQCPHVNATCFFLDQQTQHILACSSIFSFRRFILSKFSSMQSIMVDLGYLRGSTEVDLELGERELNMDVGLLQRFL